MALWQGASGRKPTGGRLVQARNKRRFEIGREAVDTHLGPHTQRILRTKGGNQKVAVLRTDRINVTDPKTGRASPAKIQTVVENRANIHYVRRNIMTKGAVVQTDKGKVRITSRPGQHGVLCGVLVE